MSQVQQKFGCVDHKDSANNHQMQLWMEHTPAHGADNAFRFVVRNVDLSSGGRRCELDSGSRATYEDALAAGQASFARQSAPPATPAS